MVSIDEVDEISDVSSIIRNLQLAITTTNVIDLCFGGDVMTPSIGNESEPRIISREYFLVVNG